MAGAYSRDLRARVVWAVEGGLSRCRAAAFFALAVSTVAEWVRVWRDSGSLSPKPMGGDYSSRLKGERAWPSPLRLSVAKLNLLIRLSDSIA